MKGALIALKLRCGLSLWTTKSEALHAKGRGRGESEQLLSTYPVFCQCDRAHGHLQDEEEEEAEAGDAEAGQGSKGGGRRRWRLSQWLSRGSGQGRRGSAKQHEGAEKGTPKGDARDASQRQASGELAPGKETGPAPGGAPSLPQLAPSLLPCV